MTVRDLRLAFADWRRQRLPLVLASVYETEGSTYSKAGARMLITGDGRFCGLLSGGCLEGDLAERAQEVLASGTPRSAFYDLGGGDAELWGLGVGCDGRMRVFLQPLLPGKDYQPFAAMERVYAGEEAAVSATVLESAGGGLRPGATVLATNEDVQAFGVPRALAAEVAAAARHALSGAPSHAAEMRIGGGPVRLLLAHVTPPPAILVLGAGLDAGPLVRLAAELGWRVTVQDHRPLYLERGEFTAAERVFNEPPEQLGEKVLDRRYQGVIVMSHHLATDRQYLRQLAGTDIPYVGLLGPPARRQRLLEALGPDAERLENRLHGPAGLDIGADGPASIALAILAEMHEHLKLRQGMAPEAPERLLQVE